MIYHVITSAAWESQRLVKSLEVPSLKTEGFIHCCTHQQVAGVLERYFKGQTNLLLLEIDEAKLESELRFEKSTNDELFPHVYGPINKTAILTTTWIKN